jgi:hypothetical protein
MGFMSEIGDLLKQASGGGGATAEQFSALAGAVPESPVASGLTEVFRSGETPPFAQLASQLFSKSSGTRQASMMNSRVAAVGPEMLSKVTGSSTSPLASLLAGNQAPITPALVKPEDVKALAEHAEKADLNSPGAKS